MSLCLTRQAIQRSLICLGLSSYEFSYARPSISSGHVLTTGFHLVKQFIRNVRASKTIADERSVVQKESAAIRASFREESGDHNIR